MTPLQVTQAQASTRLGWSQRPHGAGVSCSGTWDRGQAGEPGTWWTVSQGPIIKRGDLDAEQTREPCPPLRSSQEPQTSSSLTLPITELHS